MFTDEAVARAKLASLLMDEFNKKQAESNKLAAAYGVTVESLEQAERSLHKTRMAGIGATIVAYAKLSRAVNSLRQSGLENTAEVRRQQVAYTMLGREVAAVFMPATTASTNATIAAANAMGRLNEKGQNMAFVLSAAVTGMVALKAVQLAAVATGLKFTGVTGSIVSNLGKIGLLGGLLGGLGAIFLSTESGAESLNYALGEMAKLINEIGDAMDDAIKNPGKFFDDFKLGLIKIGENAGILEPGAARKFFDETTVPNAKARGGLDERRTREKDKRNQVSPGVPSFGSIDSFERLQLAAAKVATGKEIPAQQLDIAKQQLEIDKQVLELMRRDDPGAGLFSGGGDF